MMQRGTTTPARGLLALNGTMIAPTDLPPIASLRVGRPLAETPLFTVHPARRLRACQLAWPVGVTVHLDRRSRRGTGAKRSPSDVQAGRGWPQTFMGSELASEDASCDI
jgi:hypothetical protein